MNNAAPTIQNTNEPHNTLITINVAAQTPLKLTSTNYVSWKLQFQTLFVEYNLLGYIDGSKPCPPANITQNQATTPNPAYTVWIRQDQLILNAIIGSLSPTIIPFIARAKTAREAWTILATTYAQQSRGRIKQVKTHFKNLTKGSLSITEFLQTVKAKADKLAILSAPVDNEDLTDKILDNLGDDYKELVRAVQARDNPILFEELHEKLLNFEASLQGTTSDPLYFPVSANPTNRTNYRGRNFSTSGTINNNWRSSSTTCANNKNLDPPPSSYSRSGSNTPRTERYSPRPYLGYCQICQILGHTAKRCSSFRLVPIETSNNSSAQTSTSPWQPRANFAANTSDTPSWLLDSGASHHVTSDLSNLSLHAPYPGSDDIMIGDGTTLPITHTGSTFLQTHDV